MKKFASSRLLVGLACAVGAGTAWMAHAQFASGGVGKDFTYPFYWPAKSGVARKKYVVTGQEFRPVTNGVFALTQARIESFREDGTTLVWTAISPACVVNINSGEAHGGTNVFLRLADDRAYHTGVGFLWQQNDSVLILSNKVFTWLDTRRTTNAPGATANQSTNKMKTTLALSLLVTARLTAAEMEVPPVRPGLKIWGDINVIYLTNNLVLYSNNVVVIDPPSKPGGPETRMTCEWATMKQVGNQVDEIAAHGRVAVDQGDLHARGNFGLYTATNEMVVLVGTFNPADTNNLRPYLYKLVETNSAAAFPTNSGDAIIYNRRDGTLTTLKAETYIPSSALKSIAPTNSPRATNGPAKPPK